VESLHGDAEVSTLWTSVQFERAITFDSTVGSPLNFYGSFQTLFSQE